MDKKIIHMLEIEAENKQDEFIEFLKGIVEIPTENPPGINYEKFSTFFLSKLEELGYSSKIIRVPKKRLRELVQFGQGERFIVIGKQGNGRIRVAFNGHYDVVPAGNGWLYDPYKPVIKNGFLYGRGSSDMKSGLAMQLYAIELLKKSFPEIFKKFTFIQTAVPDEETVGNKNAGTYYLVEKKIFSKDNLDLVVFTEPQGLKNIYYGHRGAMLESVTIKGAQSHGAMPYLGKNAINVTCKSINELNTYLADKAKKLISKYPIIPEESRRPTISINTLNCGIWANTVADRCSFTIFRRLIPEENLNEAREEIKKIILSNTEKQGLEAEFTEHYATESILEDTENLFYKSYAESILDVLNVKPSFVLSPGTFDLRFTHNAGIPSLNYGPGILEEAHMANEKVKIDDIKKAAVVTAYAMIKIAKSYHL